MKKTTEQRIAALEDRLIAEGGLYQVLYERQFRDEAEPVGLDG